MRLKISVQSKEWASKISKRSSSGQRTKNLLVFRISHAVAFNANRALRVGTCPSSTEPKCGDARGPTPRLVALTATSIWRTAAHHGIDH